MSYHIECDKLKKKLFAASHDVCCAFDLCIHSQLLLSTSKCGFDKSIIETLRNIYSRLKVFVKVFGQSRPVASTTVIPVTKVIRHGAISSLPLNNNSIIDAWVVVRFIFRGLDISLLNYADDIFYLSRTRVLIESFCSVK